MAKVTDFVFDDSLIAYIDASGVPIKLRSLFDALMVGPFRQMPGDPSLVIYPSKRSSLPAGPYVNYWSLYAPLHRLVKDYFENYPVRNIGRWENWRSLAPVRVFDVRSNPIGDIFYSGQKASENVILSGYSIQLRPGFSNGYAIFAAINLMPLIAVLYSRFVYAASVPVGGSVSVSFAVSIDNLLIPEASAFTPFPSLVTESFIPFGFSGYRQWVWLKYELSRPPGDLSSPCVVSSADYSVIGSLWG